MNKTLALVAIFTSMLQAGEKNDSSKNTEKSFAVVDKESHDLMGAEHNELKLAFYRLSDELEQQKEEIEKLKAENAELRARLSEPAVEGPNAAPLKEYKPEVAELKDEDITAAVKDEAEIWLNRKIRRFKNVFEMSPYQIRTFIKGFQYAVKQAGNNATFSFSSDQDEDIRVAVNAVNKLESYGFTVQTLYKGAVTVSIGDSKAKVTISSFAELTN